MTERELDRTKSELVRALRRRAAELDAHGEALAATRVNFKGARRDPSSRGQRVAFFKRDTFMFTALTSSGAKQGD